MVVVVVRIVRKLEEASSSPFQIPSICVLAVSFNIVFLLKLSKVACDDLWDVLKAFRA